jgi:hypothetical protein
MRSSLSSETPGARLETSTKAKQCTLPNQAHITMEIFKVHNFHLDINRGRGAPFEQNHGDVIEISNGSPLIAAKNDKNG